MRRARDGNDALGNLLQSVPCEEEEGVFVVDSCESLESDGAEKAHNGLQGAEGSDGRRGTLAVAETEEDDVVERRVRRTSAAWP
jgi:hypothetical protein